MIVDSTLHSPKAIQIKHHKSSVMIILSDFVSYGKVLREYRQSRHSVQQQANYLKITKKKSWFYVDNKFEVWLCLVNF